MAKYRMWVIDPETGKCLTDKIEVEGDPKLDAVKKFKKKLDELHPDIFTKIGWSDFWFSKAIRTEIVKPEKKEVLELLKEFSRRIKEGN